MHHHSLLTLFSIPSQRWPFAYTTPSSINLLHEIFCITWFCGISWTSGHCQTLTARPSCQLPRRGHRGIFHCSGTWRPMTQLLSVNQGFCHQMMGYTSKVGSVPELQAARWSLHKSQIKSRLREEGIATPLPRTLPSGKVRLPSAFVMSALCQEKDVLGVRYGWGGRIVHKTISG